MLEFDTKIRHRFSTVNLDIVASLMQTDKDKQKQSVQHWLLTFGASQGILHLTSILGIFYAFLGTPDVDLVPVPLEHDLINIGRSHDKVGG